MQRSGLGVSLRFTSKGAYVATVHDETSSPFSILGESEEFEDASHALLIACLQADRKLREASLPK
jgi:hypothetical protein